MTPYTLAILAWLAANALLALCLYLWPSRPFALTDAAADEPPRYQPRTGAPAGPADVTDGTAPRTFSSDRDGVGPSGRGDSRNLSNAGRLLQEFGR